MPVVKQAGETPELVTAYYYQTLSLVQRYELCAAHRLMPEGFEVAERIGDGRARAYARAGLMHCRTRLGLDTFEEAERRKAELMEDCRKFDDNFLRNSAYFVRPGRRFPPHGSSVRWLRACRFRRGDGARVDQLAH